MFRNSCSAILYSSSFAHTHQQCAKLTALSSSHSTFFSSGFSGSILNLSSFFYLKKNFFFVNILLYNVLHVYKISNKVLHVSFLHPKVPCLIVVGKFTWFTWWSVFGNIYSFKMRVLCTLRRAPPNQRSPCVRP